MKELSTEEDFEALPPGERAEVGDRVEVSVPPDEHVDRPGRGTILRITWTPPAPRLFVIRMDPVDTDLCSLPGFLYVAGPKYWKKQVSTEENLTWLGEHISLEQCDSA